MELQMFQSSLICIYALCFTILDGIISILLIACVTLELYIRACVNGMDYLNAM